MAERGLLRRVAAILYHRRAGFTANGMGVWKVPEDDILEGGRRMAAFRGISPLLPAPDLRRLALLSCSRWLTAAPRRSATRSSTRSADEVGGIDGPRNALLRAPSSRRSGCSTSPTTSSRGSEEHA